MSGRDRLARREAAEKPVADCANCARSPPSRPIGTNGTVGEDEEVAKMAVSQHWRTPTEPIPSGSKAALEPPLEPAGMTRRTNARQLSSMTAGRCANGRRSFPSSIRTGRTATCARVSK
jgi:hypothetical protein